MAKEIPVDIDEAAAVEKGDPHKILHKLVIHGLIPQRKTDFRLIYVNP